MAYAFRPDDPRIVFIRISRGDFPAQGLVFALGLDGREYPLTRVALQQNTLAIQDELCQVERILQRSSTGQASLVIRHASGAAPDHVEPVLFHHSFFLPFVDYARSMPLGGGYAKPGLLACFTHVYDDNDMLRFWESHHARLAGHRNLYVIDHGSPVSPRTVLDARTNVVALPRGDTDHANMARFCGHFQRFLLSQYRFVLHTDADELLVHEDGEAALLARLEADGKDGIEGIGGIVMPGHACDILHDLRGGPGGPGGEGPLEPGALVSAQRSVMLPATGIYKKPVLADIPASWLEGFHQVYEEASLREEPRLWLMHLQSADFDLLLQKNRKWNAVHQTEKDRRISPQNRPGDKESLEQWFARALADERLEILPGRLRGKF